MISRRPAAVLSIVQACKLLGMDAKTDPGAPRRLRRMMLDQERYVKRKLWPRASRRETGGGSKLRCTMPLLHVHLPHLFDIRAELPHAIEERFREIAAEQQSAKQRDRALGARIAKIESAMRLAAAG